MPEGLLCEAFGHTGYAGALGPRITVGMQGHSENANRFQAANECLCSMIRFGADDFGKERAGLWQLLQQRRGFLAKGKNDRRFVLAAIESDGAVLPVDVLPVKARNVRLRAADMPDQFVICT